MNQAEDLKITVDFIYSEHHIYMRIMRFGMSKRVRKTVYMACKNSLRGE